MSSSSVLFHPRESLVDFGRGGRRWRVLGSAVLAEGSLTFAVVVSNSLWAARRAASAASALLLVALMFVSLGGFDSLPDFRAWMFGLLRGGKGRISWRRARAVLRGTSIQSRDNGTDGVGHRPATHDDSAGDNAVPLRAT